MSPLSADSSLLSVARPYRERITVDKREIDFPKVPLQTSFSCDTFKLNGDWNIGKIKEGQHYLAAVWGRILQIPESL